MKVINYDTFINLPVGIVVSKWEPCMMREPFIKGDSINNIDFYYTEIIYPEDIIYLPEKGESPLELNCESRDGLFEKDQLFVIWSGEDIAALVSTLIKAQSVNTEVYSKLTETNTSEDGILYSIVKD